MIHLPEFLKRYGNRYGDRNRINDLYGGDYCLYRNGNGYGCGYDYDRGSGFGNLCGNGNGFGYGSSYNGNNVFSIFNGGGFSKKFKRAVFAPEDNGE